MKIETKFNIGETIYPISVDICGRWSVDKPFEIQIIEITISGIKYWNVGFYRFPENCCFATEKKAQAECNRRNK